MIDDFGRLVYDKKNNRYGILLKFSNGYFVYFKDGKFDDAITNKCLSDMTVNGDETKLEDMLSWIDSDSFSDAYIKGGIVPVDNNIVIINSSITTSMAREYFQMYSMLYYLPCRFKRISLDKYKTFTSKLLSYVYEIQHLYLENLLKSTNIVNKQVNLKDLISGTAYLNIKKVDNRFISQILIYCGKADIILPENSFKIISKNALNSEKDLDNELNTLEYASMLQNYDIFLMTSYIKYIEYGFTLKDLYINNKSLNNTHDFVDGKACPTYRLNIDDTEIWKDGNIYELGKVRINKHLYCEPYIFDYTSYLKNRNRDKILLKTGKNIEYVFKFNLKSV